MKISTASDGATTTQPSKKTGEVKVELLHNKYRLKLGYYPRKGSPAILNLSGGINLLLRRTSALLLMAVVNTKDLIFWILI